MSFRQISVAGMSNQLYKLSLTDSLLSLFLYLLFFWYGFTGSIKIYFELLKK